MDYEGAYKKLNAKYMELITKPKDERGREGLYINALFIALEVLEEKIKCMHGTTYAKLRGLELCDRDRPCRPIQPDELKRRALGWEYKDYYCPRCMAFLVPEPGGNSKTGMERCRQCGQLIDWDNKEE